MAAVATLARALADDGGAVVWTPDPARPTVRVAPQWAAELRRDAATVRDVLERAVAFRAQIEAAQGAALPLLRLPDAPPLEIGACHSCGAAPVSHHRCLACCVALYAALDAIDVLRVVLPELVAA
jgi:hypothetical protein